MGLIIETVSIIVDQSSSVSAVAIYCSGSSTGGRDHAAGPSVTYNVGEERPFAAPWANGRDTRKSGGLNRYCAMPRLRKKSNFIALEL
ncbi:hypothetical protein [Sulfitobacter sp. 1A12126]|uniref:hypothetical protein n=1 Tax=Sulfitobacter sp. 1A12126 TaxID=3368591 RepID=UPI00374928C7